MAARSKQLEGILGRAIPATPVIPNAERPVQQTAKENIAEAADPLPTRPNAKREREVSIQFHVPETIRHAIKARAVENGESVREVVLRALLRDGFDIPDELIRDRRRSDTT